MLSTGYRALYVLILFALPGLTALYAELPPIPQKGVYLGTKLTSWQTSAAEFNQTTGLRHAILQEYIEFPEVLNLQSSIHQKLTTFLKECRSVGAMPLVTLETVDGLDCYSPQQVEEFVDLLNATGLPTLLRWNHEMNGSWYAWGLQPAKYIRKFREFTEVVRQRSDNIAMVWAPNHAPGYPWGATNSALRNPVEDLPLLDTNLNGSVDSGDDPYTPFYPGDAYVDWVGISYYHWGSSQEFGVNSIPDKGKFGRALGIDSFAPRFHDLFSVKRGKPMIIPETGAFFGPDLKNFKLETRIKQNWINQVYNLIDPSQPRLTREFPGIKAIVWFNVAKIEDATGTLVDWRIDQNPEVLKSYQNAVNNDYFLESILPHDQVWIKRAPKVLNASTAYKVSVEYEASEPRDIQVNLLSRANFAWLGGNRVSVPAGKGKVVVSIAPERLPEKTEAVFWMADLLPSGSSDPALVIDTAEKAVAINKPGKPRVSVTAPVTDLTVRSGSQVQFRFIRSGDIRKILALPIQVTGPELEEEDKIQFPKQITFEKNQNEVILTYTLLSDIPKGHSKTLEVSALKGRGFKLGLSATAVVTLTGK